ncbi:MAG: phage tail sheath family protein [Pyrinomonadaceae bacterium]
MPEYLAPGAHVEETSFRPRSIEGVSTNVTGFVGTTRFGPVGLAPEVFTGLTEFEHCYGEGRQLEFHHAAKSHNYLWHAVRAFFAEGGQRLHIARIFRPLSAGDVVNGGEVRYAPPGQDIIHDAHGTTGGLYADGHARSWIPSDPGDNSRADSLLVRARYPGVAGNLRVTFTVKLGQNLLAGEKGNLTVKTLRDYDMVWIGDVVGPRSRPIGSGAFRVARYNKKEDTWIFGRTAAKTKSDLRLNSGNSIFKTLDPAQGHELRVATLTVSIEFPDGGNSSVRGDLALDPRHTDSDGALDSLLARFAQTHNNLSHAPSIVILAGKRLNTGIKVLQALINYSATSGTNRHLSAHLNRRDATDGERSVELPLGGGNDGQRPGANEYSGYLDANTNDKFGLTAFEDLEDISIIAAPGSTANYAEHIAEATATTDALVAHAARMRYRIAVLDSGDQQTISDVRALRARIDSRYAALYYPWVRVLDPITGTDINLPPSGFVAGIYARNDANRGVFKAPANETVRLASGFERKLTRAEQEILNPEGINCFRFFEGSGFRLWGARTTSSDPEWKYVNVRRYFAYLERSIAQGTQWAVFEPNSAPLWDDVRRVVGDFLYSEWKRGGLPGAKAEQAFFVRCDRSTMTQADLDNGRLVCNIGVAPLRPAEFVIIRIGQWTADRKDS